ncbi:MAG: hypothetical protein LQ338_007142 [Usnochroma carphineum]|nr:MAG: hypothetical protein LQ338_007142 [Usnochroma carphineum]
MRNGLRTFERQLRALSRKRGLPTPAHRPPSRNGVLPSRSYASVSAADLQFGQPLHETHPHLLKPGELTPGITALEYAQRRSRLASKLPKNGVAILAASELKYRSGPVFYKFHQDSDFFYLTGTMNDPSLSSG